MRQHLIAALLLLIFVSQSFFYMRNLSATHDEVSHLPSGISYWKTKKIELNQQHPPLLKLLAALPVIAIENPRLPTEVTPQTDEWAFGAQLLFTQNGQRMLFLARLVTLLFGALLGVLLYVWASKLYGLWSGIFVLSLYAFSPPFIAHSCFVTMDVALTFFILLSAYLIFERRTILSGASLGFAIATKFSGLLALVLPVIRSINRGKLIPIFALTALTVWICYFAPFDLSFYIRGLKLLYHDVPSSYPFYLSGNFRIGGWWYYWPAVFALKFPVGVVIAIAGGLLLILTKGNSVERKLLFFGILFFVVTAITAKPFGVRYLLPSVAFLLLLSGRFWAVLLNRSSTACFAVLLLFSTPVWSVLRTSNYLAYFSEAATGEGYRYLDDSNVEWGEGLIKLHAFLESNHLDSIKLFYPWTGSPQYYGIHFSPVTSQELLVEDWTDSERPSSLADAVYVLSTQAVIRMPYLYPDSWVNKKKPDAIIDSSFFVFDLRSGKSPLKDAN